MVLTFNFSRSMGVTNDREQLCCTAVFLGYSWMLYDSMCSVNVRCNENFYFIKDVFIFVMEKGLVSVKCFQLALWDNVKQVTKVNQWLEISSVTLRNLLITWKS